MGSVPSQILPRQCLQRNLHDPLRFALNRILYIFINNNGVVAGLIGLVGLVLGHPYIKGTLEKLGIAPEIGKRKAYKVDSVSGSWSRD